MRCHNGGCKIGKICHPVNEEQKKKIEHDTGKNPLFLSFLLGIKENFESHLNQLLKDKIKNPMTNFSEMISKSERWICMYF